MTTTKFMEALINSYRYLQNHYIVLTIVMTLSNIFIHVFSEFVHHHWVSMNILFYRIWYRGFFINYLGNADYAYWSNRIGSELLIFTTYNLIIFLVLYLFMKLAKRFFIFYFLFFIFYFLFFIFYFLFFIFYFLFFILLFSTKNMFI